MDFSKINKKDMLKSGLKVLLTGIFYFFVLILISDLVMRFYMIPGWGWKDDFILMTYVGPFLIYGLIALFILGALLHLRKEIQKT